MKRSSFSCLQKWKQSSTRKSLLLRGARQVGKTHLVRQIGDTFSNFVELNLETHPKLCRIFEGDLDANQMVKEISLTTGMGIVPGETYPWVQLLHISIACVCFGDDSWSAYFMC